jgi:hypothetical protein
MPGSIRDHVVRDAPVDHLGELVLVPDLVDELRVDADSDDLDAELLELTVLRGDRRELGRSNEGEVTGIETDEDPLAEKVRELELLEAAVAIRRCCEIGCLATDHDL